MTFKPHSIPCGSLAHFLTNRRASHNTDTAARLLMFRSSSTLLSVSVHISMRRQASTIARMPLKVLASCPGSAPISPDWCCNSRSVSVTLSNYVLANTLKIINLMQQGWHRFRISGNACLTDTLHGFGARRLRPWSYRLT